MSALQALASLERVINQYKREKGTEELVKQIEGTMEALKNTLAPADRAESPGSRAAKDASVERPQAAEPANNSHGAPKGQPSSFAGARAAAVEAMAAGNTGSDSPAAGSSS